MSELTDDQLDGLFRKSAEEFDPPFDPAAWQDMKTRLDAHDSPAPGGTPLWKNLLRWGLPVCLLMLLTIGSLYIYRADSTRVDSAPAPTATSSQKDAGSPSELPMVDSKKQKLTTQQRVNDSAQTTPNGLSAQSIDNKNQPAVLSEPVSENASKEGHAGEARPSAGIINGLGKKMAPDATNENATAYRLKTRGKKADRSDTAPTRMASPADERIPLAERAIKRRNETAIPERTTVKKQERANRISKGRGRPLVASNDGIFTPSLSSRRPVRNVSKPAKDDILNRTETIIQPSNDEAEAAGLPDINELAIRPARWSKAMLFKGRTVEVTAAVQPDTFYQVTAPKLPTERGLSVRLAIAPDLSSVGLNNFTRPGTNVGVLLEYRLAKRWSVQAGIIQSTKIYKASASEYTAPPGSWSAAMGVKPATVDGQCSMFDIPINLRYDVLLQPRASGLSPSRWFISSGVTSYYIKQEDYKYNYSGYVHNPATPYSGSTGGYGFSHLNLSIGYEQALSRRLSWQVEPFIKMPLKGVGFYKINLISTGAFFSIRYKL